MKKILIVIYAAGVIVTFGHAWNRDFTKLYDVDGARVMTAIVGAAAWPLYWSTVAWDRNK